MKKLKGIKVTIFLLIAFFSFNSYAQACSASIYDFKNIFPKSWIIDNCSKFPCGNNKYQAMINDFHNIFSMRYLLSLKIKSAKKIETITVNNPANIAATRNIGRSKTVRSGTNLEANSYMKKIYENLASGSTIPSITDKKIIKKDENSENSFFCYLNLSSRNDLYNQTKGEGRGVVARTILYMIDRYNIKEIPTFLPEDYVLLRSWDKKYLPSAAECNRNQFIKRKQGNDNKFTTMGCYAQTL